MSNPPVISIIDDDESVRTATGSLVRSLGFRAMTFASAEEFVHSPVLDEADCVITDVQMPGMSGLELQALMNARARRTPMIFMTAFPEARIRERVEAGGAYGFLAKPFDGGTMIACIERALSARA